MGFKARKRPASPASPNLPSPSNPPTPVDELFSGKAHGSIAFKPSLAALDEEDLVAFANSNGGGVIVLGVEQSRKARGGKTLQVIGSPAGARERRKIVEMAKRCVPPVEISISALAHEGKKLLRIDIAQSARRPHCTSRGTYMIREAHASVPLTPDKLGSLLVPQPSGVQAGTAAKDSAPAPERPHRAESAVADMIDALLIEMANLPDRLQASLKTTERTLGELGSRIEKKLSDLTEAVDAEAEDSLIHIGLSTIRQAQKIGFESLSQRLDDTSQLVHKILKRVQLEAKSAQQKAAKSPIARPSVVLVQLKLDAADLEPDTNVNEPGKRSDEPRRQGPLLEAPRASGKKKEARAPKAASEQAD